MGITEITLPKTGLAYNEKEILNRQSFGNEALLKEQEFCGCYHCGNIFSSEKIVDWIEESNDKRTALCPCCGIDSIIIGSEQHPLTIELLAFMHAEWFFEEERGLQEGTLLAPEHKDEDYYRLGIAFQLKPLPDNSETVELLGLSTWSSCLPECKRDEEAEALMDSVVNGSILLIKFNEDGRSSFQLVQQHSAEIPLEPFRANDEDAIREIATSHGGEVFGIVQSKNITRGNAAPAAPEFHCNIYTYEVVLVGKRDLPKERCIS